MIDESVPSRARLTLNDVLLFLIILNIRSSPALECGNTRARRATAESSDGQKLTILVNYFS